MKIIQITPAYKPVYIYGGPTMSVAKLCEALIHAKDVTTEFKNEDIDLEVFTTTANGKDELNVEVGKKVNVDDVLVTYFKRVTKDHTHFSPALLWALRKKIKQHHKFEIIIHIHSWWNLVAIFSCLICKWYRVPVILSPRGMLTRYTQANRNSILKSLLHTLIGKSLLRYSHIIASTELEQRDVLKIIKPKTISIIPNLVNLPPTTSHGRLGAKGSVFSLLFLSRIEEKKGLDILFDALAEVHIPWTLTIGGNGEKNYVSSLNIKAEQLGLKDKLTWLGQVNNEDKFALMASYDLLVLTSHNENFANVIIESLNEGTPVLVSDQVGLSNYVSQKSLGWVTSLKKNEIKNKIEEAYENVERRNVIRQKAPKIIASDFNEQTLIKQYTTLFYKICNDRLSTLRA